MNTKRIMQRAFILLLLMWGIDFVNLILLQSTADDVLGGYLMLTSLRSFFTMIVLGLLVYEVSITSKK